MTARHSWWRVHPSNLTVNPSAGVLTDLPLAPEAREPAIRRMTLEVRGMLCAL